MFVCPLLAMKDTSIVSKPKGHTEKLLVIIS